MYVNICVDTCKSVPCGFGFSPYSPSAEPEPSPDCRPSHEFRLQSRYQTNASILPESGLECLKQRVTARPLLLEWHGPPQLRFFGLKA